MPKEELLSTCKFPGAINLTISPDFIGTTWRGWGTSLSWFANYVGGLPPKQLNAMLDLIFDPINGLGLNIVRFNIGGGHNDKRSPQFHQSLEAYWRGMPGYKPTMYGPYDWNADVRQRNVLLGAKARGANAFEAFSNSPPWWMTQSGDVAGAYSKGRTNLLPQNEKAFADYLTTVVAEFAKRWGVTFDALEPFNEALEAFWKVGKEHEGCTFNPPEMGRVIKYTSDSLQAKGLTTKLVGVDSWDGTTAQLPKIANHELLTRINVHAYVNQYLKEGVAATYEIRYGSIRDTAKQLGREVWVSEAGALGKSGSFWDLSLYMARNVIESVNIMEASAYHVWQAYDFAAHWSLIDFPPDYPPGYRGEMTMPKANRRFWIFKHFTMLAKPGSKPLKPKGELLPTCKFPGEINLTISPDFIGTTWRGWGTSLGWFANYVGGLPPKQLTAMLDLIFDPINGLGLNIVRYNIGGGHNNTLSPQFNQSLEAHWRGMPGYKPTKDGPYDWSADQRQRKVLLGSKARGANVFEAFSNSPPWWMTRSGDVGGAVKGGETNMRPDYEDDFADYLTTVVAEFAKRWNVTFDALEPFNEALEGFWKAGDDHEGCTFNQPEMGRVIKYTSESLQAKNLTTKLVGVDSWDGTTAQLPKISNHELLTRINVHAYINQYFKEGVDVTYEVRYGSIRDTGKKLGREVWVSEAGALGKNGSFWDLSLYMARNVIESVNIMEASAYHVWQAYDFAAHWSCIDFPPDYPPGYSGKMVMPKVNKRFWIFKHFTMLAKPGSKPLKKAVDRPVVIALDGFMRNVALLGIAAHPKPVTAARRAGGADGNKRAPPPDLLPAFELLSTCKSKGAINVTLLPEFVGTTWRGWGTSLAWFANYVGGLPQQQLTAILDLIFEPIYGLGLNIVRYNIGGGHNDTRSPQFHQNSDVVWRGIPGYKPTKDGPYDWSADERQRNVLLGAKERGANVFEAFSNSPPWWMTVTGDVAGAVWKGATNLLPEYEKAFADYLTTVVAEYAKRWKIRFDALEPFNEALEGFWKVGKEHEGCTFNPPEMGRFIKYTSDSLKAKGLKTKLVGVDSWDGMTAQLPQIANHELLTRINVHAYVNSYHEASVAATYEKRFGSIRDTAKLLGREVWVSEAGALGKRGSNWDLSLYMARNVMESINIMEASAYMLWQAYDFAAHWSCIDFPPNYPANYTGEMDMPRANKRFWIFKHFTLLAGPGTKPLRIGSDCWHGMSAFYSPSEKRVTVFVVNQKAEDRHVTINLDGFTMNVGGTTKVVVRRTTWSTDFTVKVYSKQVARLIVWGQSFASVTFTNVSY
ncbi:unnamed protein product [Closterium sp. Yama58-4]|nr:unnamed protein product [Closterium sp. Yama58-4]